jgi:hypothetical protein
MTCISIKRFRPYNNVTLFRYKIRSINYLSKFILVRLFVVVYKYLPCIQSNKRFSTKNFLRIIICKVKTGYSIRTIKIYIFPIVLFKIIIKRNTCHKSTS